MSKSSIEQLDSAFKSYSVNMEKTFSEFKANVSKMLSDAKDDISLGEPGKIKEVTDKIAKLNTSLDKLNKSVDVYEYQMNYMFWNNYRSENESVTDAKKRFFLGLKPDNEDVVAVQKAALLLMKEVKRICEKHDIEYWLDVGSLMGAVRHKGFIPWATSSYIGIMRKELEKLKDAVNNEETYIKLDNFNAIRMQCCNIIRIKFKDSGIPLFMDVFVYDFCDKSDDSAWNEYRKHRREFSRSLMKYKPVPLEGTGIDIVEKHRIINEEHLGVIKDTFEKHQKKLTDSIGLDNEDGKAVIWGIDNFSYYVGKKCILKKESIFPLKKLSFCGEEYPVPNDYIAFLKCKYADIYKLPDDILAQHNIKRPAELIEKYKAITEKYSK